MWMRGNESMMNFLLLLLLAHNSTSRADDYYRASPASRLCASVHQLPAHAEALQYQR
jgi:hypothetical protein